MSDIPEHEDHFEPPKKTRKVNPGGKKRGPKPKPVNKKIPVRELEQPLDEDVLVVDEGYKSPQELIEYMEVTIMEQTDEPRECFFNNGVLSPVWCIRGHKVILPKSYVDVMDEINKIQLLKHEPIDNGADFREYYVPLMRFPYMLHRSGLTFADYRAQFEKQKGMKDPWNKARETR